MASAANYKRFQYTLAPGEMIKIVRAARQVTCLAATAGFKMRLDQQPETEFEAGLSLAPAQPFASVEVRNTSGSTNTIALGFANGDLIDGRLTLGGEISTRPAVPGVLTTGAAVTALTGAATLLAAANSLRRQIVLVNQDAAATVYIGGNGAAVAGEGLPLLAGQSLVLDTTAATYARNDSGAGVLVAVAELEFAT